MTSFHATTILSVRRGNEVAIAGDGQVSLGQTVAKSDAVKVRKIPAGQGHEVLVGFAGSAADAFALLERFEQKLKDSPGNIKKAAIDLAKQWRTDRYMRRLESLLAVADKTTSLMVSGQGDVIEPTDGIIGIGSGGPYALAAARALLNHTDLPPADLAREALKIAGEICVYTNTNITVETL
ncbi:ATP-dependent protease subunit HslV [Planctomycetales bacterium ZRK34]|nr:ATP-dependent protease subunit HslV [Planctomycetales bacterium ZRK34]